MCNVRKYLNNYQVQLHKGLLSLGQASACCRGKGSDVSTQPTSKCRKSDKNQIILLLLSSFLVFRLHWSSVLYVMSHRCKLCLAVGTLQRGSTVCTMSSFLQALCCVGVSSAPGGRGGARQGGNSRQTNLELSVQEGLHRCTPARGSVVKSSGKETSKHGRV